MVNPEDRLRECKRNIEVELMHMRDSLEDEDKYR
jgi:hypothetical protein